MKPWPLALLALVCVTLAGCSTAASLDEMTRPPVATLAGEWLTIRMGGSTKGPVYNVSPHVKVEGNQVLVTGRHTHQSVSREFTVMVKQGAAIEAFWVEPDRKRVAIPITVQSSGNDTAAIAPAK